MINIKSDHIKDISLLIKAVQPHMLKVHSKLCAILKSYKCKCLMSWGDCPAGKHWPVITAGSWSCSVSVWHMTFKSLSLMNLACFDGSRLFHNPNLYMTFKSPYSVFPDQHMCRFIFREVLHMVCSYIHSTTGLLCINSHGLTMLKSQCHDVNCYYSPSCHFRSIWLSFFLEHSTRCLVKSQGDNKSTGCVQKAQ